jgi:KDO2-lipid IV(A) lauroyltransferase
MSSLSFGRWLRYRGEWLVVRVCFAFVRLLGLDAASAFGGWSARTIGPLLPLSRLARANLALAFPEKSRREIATILRGVWDNLGRTFAEYLFLDTIWNEGAVGDTPSKRIAYAGEDRFFALRDDGKSALIFAAHLANWEMPAIGAARYNLDVSILFRPPNNPFVAHELLAQRSAQMGRLIATRYGAAAAALKVLEEGGHVAMLVDTHTHAGIQVPFFGRPAWTSIAFAKLARRTRCPVHGVRVERLGGANFKVTLSPPLTVPVTDDENADIKALVTEVHRMIEGWVRERPEQWNWLHNRWRP